MVRLLGLVVTNFYDDYCQMEVDDLCDSAQATAAMLLKLLGWKVAEEHSKALPFSSSICSGLSSP